MSKIFEQLLRVRDLDAGFLSPKYEESIDPQLLPDMAKAVERIERAVKAREKVLIYGDYDVDGVTASTLMAEALRLAGVTEVEIMLPNRFTDGYGMSAKVVQRAEEMGVRLVITVDCGSRNHEIVEQLLAKGVETIVTDHHECAEALPPAVAVLNPKRADARDFAQGDAMAMTELRMLAGVGVAFKLAQALVKAGLIPAGQEKWLLDLVLIGTICDSMSLLGENRRLCYYGMKVLEKTRRPGLKEIIRGAGVKQLNSDSIGYQIGPRLNAAGRMETAEIALRLLRSTSRLEAAALAANLEELNNARKHQQREAVNEVRARGVGDEAVLVEVGNWHEGVLGIIAGKLTEEYQRPAFALAEVDGVLKGSGRSFGDFSLAGALKACFDQLISGGGHAEACGVKLDKARLEDFRKAVNDYYKSLNLSDQRHFLSVHEDLEVTDFDDLSLELIAELRKLEPFGPGNEEPIFLLPEVKVADVARLGAEHQHLRLTVWDRNGQSFKLMQFYAPEEYLNLQGGEVVNVWMTLNENEFRGIRSAEGRILRLS